MIQCATGMNCMNTVQKHRKETAICKSPEDFWDIFNKDKFGAQYHDILF